MDYIYWIEVFGEVVSIYMGFLDGLYEIKIIKRIFKEFCKYYYIKQIIRISLITIVLIWHRKTENKYLNLNEKSLEPLKSTIWGSDRKI